MTQTKDFSGKDINNAITNACAALMLSKNELKYDVISEGISGIFGIVGRKDAKIRVTLSCKNPEQEKIKSIVDEAFGKETRLEKSDKSNQIELEPVPVTEESIALGTEALQKIVNTVTDDAIVKSQTDQDHLLLSIEGGNTGILIGKKGQTLDAMQFLIDKIINRKSEARVKVKVDVEGYMESRESHLIDMANKMANKAKKTGYPATINQMSSQDRRIVHMALKEDNMIRTQSIGDGYYRKLVIFPKKKASYKGKNQSKR